MLLLNDVKLQNTRTLGEPQNQKLFQRARFGSFQEVRRGARKLSMEVALAITMYTEPALAMLEMLPQ